MAEGAPPISVVGLHGGQWFGCAAGAAIAGADHIVGHARHLEAVGPQAGEALELFGDLPRLFEQITDWHGAGRRVCVLASGDPGFFGLVRLAAARFGPENLSVHPAPSSVAMAFARLSDNWDDAVVVSAHGRPLGPAVEAVRRQAKVAVLCSPENPPEAIGGALSAFGGAPERAVAVLSRLGEPDEEVWQGDVAGLAAGGFDPLSVAVFRSPRGWTGAEGSGPTVEWGRDEARFAHRAGMVTKSEVRAVALGKLGLPRAGVMWDVGAGSGSVALEAAGLSPGLEIFAIDRDVSALRTNAGRTAVRIVEGPAPGIFSQLPDPDRIFVGGGGAEVLDAALGRLLPRGRLVATYASPERAAYAYRQLGAMVQVSASRAVPVGDSFRLAAANPVFVCWGPQ